MGHAAASAADGDQRIAVGGPYFDDLAVGQVFHDAPGLTLTAGHAVLHQALFGDRLRLPLDHHLSAAVTRHTRPLAHPLLVCNAAIGQTTAASQRVLGNLFYRGLVLLQPVHLGDTLRTSTEVVGLRQNRPRPGREPSGVAALRVRTVNQDGKAVLDFWRCPMLPLRDPRASTGHEDRFGAIPADVRREQLEAAIPAHWDVEAFRACATDGGHVRPGVTYVVEGRDTVTCAPELVRATLNLARTHTDAEASVYGRRLVYGGHTIAMAGAQVSRALPHLVTILAWRSCDHTGAVFEDDVLRTEVSVEAVETTVAGYRLVDLRARVFAADSGVPAREERAVLDWCLVGLLP